MRCERLYPGSGRRLKFTDLPDTVEDLAGLPELEVDIRYTGESSGRKAIVLDNAIIPELVRRVNGFEALLTACRIAFEAACVESKNPELINTLAAAIVATQERKEDPNG